MIIMIERKLTQVIYDGDGRARVWCELCKRKDVVQLS